MTPECLERWLVTLGYSAAQGSLHLADGEPVPADHPYAVEINELLRSDGAIGARAVFDVEGAPTVCFLTDSEGLVLDGSALERIRQRIWNQNLISVALVLGDSHVLPFPVQPGIPAGKPLALANASATGPFSAAEIQSGEIRQRLPNWFEPTARVDRCLLDNLGRAVNQLISAGVSQNNAQYLMGQVLFISYLEHRGIVSEKYRATCRVGALHDLVKAQDKKGLVRLVKQLKDKFNGDFLRTDGGSYEIWEELRPKAFAVINDFLSRVDLATGQQDFWPYDFSFIPVELLSGIYETFLNDEQERLGAYYTPRHLANVVVDQAFAESRDVLEETIYDGACGSGILLTTAFRRILGVAEARTGAQLTLRERIELLKSRIFGSDVSETACRVTAFSLYLSLLERLQPADIIALQENEQVKLPKLLGTNLYAGERVGDFFSSANPLAGSRRFSLFICNPPWREPEGEEVLSADVWAKGAGIPRARRQLAADFSHRALDSLHAEGRLCLILPVSLLLAPTSEDFVKGWLLRAKPSLVINFGDLQGLIFEKASNSCVVVVATPRRGDDEQHIPPQETFEYWVPKSDVSLAFGRLTLHSGDRHRVQTQAVWEDHQRLVSLMWGDAFDLSLWARLNLLGTFGDMFAGSRKRWVRRKGFHKSDKSVEKPVSSKSLRDMPYIEVDALKGDAFVLTKSRMTTFPTEIKTVANLSEELAGVFSGPRLLFPDGFSAEDRKIRAVFTNRKGSFSSSIGVVAGPKADEDLLRFAVVYLRSDLVSYFLLTRAFQVLTDRNRVSLLDVNRYPFVEPDRHPDPVRARQIVAVVANMTRELEADDVLVPQGPSLKFTRLNRYIYDYFGLSDKERELVSESVAELLPAVRPRSFKSLYTRPQHHADPMLITAYTTGLQDELREWQSSLGGAGGISVSATVTSTDRAGPWGIVHVALTSTRKTSSRVEVEQSDRAVLVLVEKLNAAGLLPMELAGEWYFAPETIIWADTDLYFVRPLSRRFWLRRTALRDAMRIVQAVQSGSAPEQQRQQKAA